MEPAEAGQAFGPLTTKKVGRMLGVAALGAGLGLSIVVAATRDRPDFAAFDQSLQECRAEVHASVTDAEKISSILPRYRTCMERRGWREFD